MTELALLFAIEIEKRGPAGYITRYADRRGQAVRFLTRAAAQAMADHLDAQAHADDDTFTSYEVIEIPAEPPRRVERDPNPPPPKPRRYL